MADLWILMSRKVCEDCETFTRKVNDQFEWLGVRFHLYVCTSSGFIWEQAVVASHMLQHAEMVVPSDPST